MTVNVELIKQKRIEKGIPQKRIGALLDLDQGKISDIEHGKRNLSFVEAVKIAKMLDLEVIDLVK